MYSPTKENNPSETTQLADELVSTYASRYWFQPSRKQNSAAAATPGKVSGKVIRQNAPNRVQPSTIAAFSKSSLRFCRYPHRTHNASGTVKDT